MWTLGAERMNRRLVRRVTPLQRWCMTNTCARIATRASRRCLLINGAYLRSSPYASISRQSTPRTTAAEKVEAKTGNAVPGSVECADCGYATYCSAGCRQAERAAHSDECGVLQAWAEAGGGPAQSRGLRLFLRLAYACQRHPATLARLKQLQSGMERLDHQGYHLDAERLQQMVRYARCILRWTAHWEPRHPVVRWGRLCGCGGGFDRRPR
jgi:hypothetical protein